MDEKLLALATPVFLISMLAEWLLNRQLMRRRGLASPTGGSGAYRLDDTLTDLGCGIGQQLLDPLFRLGAVAVYAEVQQRWGMWHWDTRSPATWAVALLLVDLMFYLFHRASHRARVLWAVHHVHHSSDEYNLAVALRQPWLEKFVDLPFYLPLAVLGMPAELYISAFTLNLIYQFFLHARWVPKLGPLEWLLNTPSHHRVHHGVNPEYIDKNYGGVLVIWDRLFGTFTAEDAPAVFGTVTPLRTWSAWTANIAPWRELLRSAGDGRGWRDAVWTWLGPPEWRPAAQGGPLTIAEPAPGVRGWGELAVPRARRFAVAALIYVGGLLAVLQQLQAGLDAATLAALAAAGVALLAAAGAGLEARRAARWWALGATLAFGAAVPLLLGWQGWALALWVGATLAMTALGLGIEREAPAVRP